MVPPAVFSLPKLAKAPAEQTAPSNIQLSAQRLGLFLLVFFFFFINFTFAFWRVIQGHSESNSTARNKIQISWLPNWYLI